METLTNFDRVEIAERMYNDVLQDLQLTILDQYQSVTNFAKVAGIDRANLNKAFNKYRGKELGLGTYIKISELLGTMPATPENNPLKTLTLTLRDYILTTQNDVLFSFSILKSIH